MNRGQVHTLEAIVAGLLLLSSVVFALEVTAVTPLSASTSSQHIENQQQSSAEGLLSIAKESGALQDAVLYWNSSDPGFHNASGVGFASDCEGLGAYSDEMPTEFGEMLERSFGDRGIAYNVRLVYNRDGSSACRYMINNGVPSDNAVTASRTVILTDDTHLVTWDNERGVEISNQTNTFYADDSDSDSGFYDAVRVEVIVWRI